MKLREVLSKVGKILKYLQRRRQRKLYQQWVEKNGLPPEAIPQEEAGGDIMPKIDGGKLRSYIIYISLGIAIVLICLGLILLIMQYR